MILELCFKPFFILIKFLITLVPSFVGSGVSSLVSFSVYLSPILSLLPNGFFSSFISSVTFYMTAQFGWVVIEWVYKKIPGVD